jgi:hypothetical protein
MSISYIEEQPYTPQHVALARRHFDATVCQLQM